MNTLNFCDTILDNKYMICKTVDADDDVNEKEKKEKNKILLRMAGEKEHMIPTYTHIQNMHHFSQCKICKKNMKILKREF